MTNPSTYSLLLFGLLLSCGSCKKQEAPAISVQANPCLIATQTTKELVSPSQQSKLEPETVTINGESFNVTTTKKSAYTYDAQGRILTEYNQYAGSQADYAQANSDSVYYQYTPTAVSIRTVKFTESGKRESRDELALNSQGLVEKRPGSGQATYDKDGYLVSLADSWGIPAKIENGNVTEWILTLEGPGTGSYTYRRYYDSSKPGLPSIRTFNGKDSRNLPAKYTVENNAYQNVRPIIHVATYSYAFDEKGRVKRQLLRGKDGEIRYVFGGDIITTNDFSYTCP